MREHEPPLHDDDFDQRFAEIVAAWERDVRDLDAPAATPPGEARGEDGRHESDPGAATEHPRPEAGSGRLLGETIPVWRGAGGPSIDEILDDDDEEHFIPAPPAPLPTQDDVHFWSMMLCLVGGPLLLLWLVLFSPDVGRWWTWLALSMCVGGFVLLVLRGPRERGPGNGAVV